MLKQEFLKDQFLVLLFCYIIRKSILKFMWPSQSKVYDDFHNPKRIELLARLKVGLSHLCDQKFKHSFQNKTLSPLCNYGKDIESSSHYLLHYSDYLHERMTLLNTGLLFTIFQIVIMTS